MYVILWMYWIFLCCLLVTTEVESGMILWAYICGFYDWNLSMILSPFGTIGYVNVCLVNVMQFSFGIIWCKFLSGACAFADLLITWLPEVLVLVFWYMQMSKCLVAFWDGSIAFHLQDETWSYSLNLKSGAIRQIGADAGYRFLHSHASLCFSFVWFQFALNFEGFLGVS